MHIRFLCSLLVALAVLLSISAATLADAGMTDFDRALQSILPTKDEEMCALS